MRQRRWSSTLLFRYRRDWAEAVIQFILCRQYLGTDFGTGIATDASGNIYVTGLAGSEDFPLVNNLVQRPNNICAPPFVAKFSPDGKTLLYSTFLVYSTNLLAYANSCPSYFSFSAGPTIAVDASGNAYISGFVPAGVSLVSGRGFNTPPTDQAFVVKLDPNGALIGTVVFGGTGAEAATSIALGKDGMIYVTGTTTSTDFPVSANAVHKTISSSQDIFLARLDPVALNILYSTYLGPGQSPVTVADAAGNAYVAASTTSTAWTTTPGVSQSVCSGIVQCADVIALKINPAGTQVEWATYLGGSGTDTIGGLAVDSSGSLYVSGTTNSGDFPTTAGVLVSQVMQVSGASRFPQTGFVAKFSPDAGKLNYSTYLTPQAGTSPTSLAIDIAGNAYVGGTTTDAAFPTKLAVQETLFNSTCYVYTPSGSGPSGETYCPRAGFLAVLNPAASALVWSTFLGGGSVTASSPLNAVTAAGVTAITVDGAGNVYATGNQIAITPGRSGASNSASIVKIAPPGTPLANVFVVSAAGFSGGLPVPGGLGALYVDAPGASDGITGAPGLPLPRQLAGFTILIDGISTPIAAVAALPNAPRVQVNFQVPVEARRAYTVEPHIVQVQFNGQSVYVIPQTARPGIFTLPDGSGAIQHAADYSLVTAGNPVKRGENLIVYMSGLGPLAAPVASGIGATGTDPVQPVCGPPTSSLGTITYAGATPGFPGLYQVNLLVSQNLPSGMNSLSIDNDCWPGFGPNNIGQSNAVGVYVP